MRRYLLDTGDHREVLTRDDFVDDNPDLADVVDALEIGQEHVDGGGAQPVWSIKRLGDDGPTGILAADIEHMAAMKEQVDQVVRRFKRGLTRLDAIELELERLRDEAGKIETQTNNDRSWLEKNMPPDDFASEFGYYPRGDR